MRSSTTTGRAIAALAIALCAPAAADRYEATVSVRPGGAMARADETGARSPVTVPAGGLTAGLSWGVRNWLDVGGEVAALALAEATYEHATATVTGPEYSGRLRRLSRLAQARATATLRFGVAWVPTVQLAVGAGVRQRLAAQFAPEIGGMVQEDDLVTPDGGDAGFAFDAVAGIRVGLDHRLTRRWSVGVSAGATACLGVDAPSLQIFDAGVQVGYTWYPLW